MSLDIIISTGTEYRLKHENNPPEDGNRVAMAWPQALGYQHSKSLALDPCCDEASLQCHNSGPSNVHIRCFPRSSTDLKKFEIDSEATLMGDRPQLEDGVMNDVATRLLLLSSVTTWLDNQASMA
ncbi:hypothetical protein KEM54_004681 [Ascosphaera aggregata]|nr:hypothetical protein KEM54_004681 [Ascosphaera aggregata]